jgi:hypothetical protein
MFLGSTWYVDVRSAVHVVSVRPGKNDMVTNVSSIACSASAVCAQCKRVTFSYMSTMIKFASMAQEACARVALQFVQAVYKGLQN